MDLKGITTVSWVFVSSHRIARWERYWVRCLCFYFPLLLENETPYTLQKRVGRYVGVTLGYHQRELRAMGYKFESSPAVNKAWVCKQSAREIFSRTHRGN